MKLYYQNPSATLYHGDCFEIMSQLAPGSFDAAITDPPYGIGECSWDKAPDCAALHAALRAVCKRNAAKVFFANLPFAVKLLTADRNRFRYDLVYWKSHHTGFLNARVMPLRAHENVLVFYDRKPTYNPQMWKSRPAKKPPRSIVSENYGKFELRAYSSDKRFPRSVIYSGFSPALRKQESSHHPTQKPVALIEYLIRTYTNEGETILDPFAGSGTAGVAAMRTGRKAVLIELEEKYCELAANRLESELEKR